MTTPSRSLLRQEMLLIGLGLWLSYGASINILNLQAYALHPIVVKTLTENGSFVLGHDEVPKQNDQFLFEGMVLPAKQPGVFVLGAAAYEACRRLGLTYEGNPFLAGAVVTWLTSSLLAAAAGASGYALAVALWGFRRRHALCGTLAAGFCTILLPYAGIPHHDTVAGAFLVMAILALEIERTGTAAGEGASGRPRPMAAFCGGLLLAATLSCSMLPGAIVLGLLLAIGANRRLAAIVPGAAGLITGLIPLGLYNAHYFHNPFLQTNLAGGYEDTYPGLEIGRIVHHLNQYLGTGDVSVVKYMPVVLLGAAGLAFFSGKRSRPGRLMAGLLLLHLLYVLSIPALGYCQYGPRFLIPAVPLAMFGLPALLERVDQLDSVATRRIGIVLIGLIALYSLAVNLTRTLGGTMYCQTERFAFPRYLAVLSDPRTWSDSIALQFPLLWPCAAMAAVLGTLVAGRRLFAGQRRTIASPGHDIRPSPPR